MLIISVGLSVCLSISQATIGIDFLSKTMYLEDRTVRHALAYSQLIHLIFNHRYGYNCGTLLVRRGFVVSYRPTSETLL